VDVTGIEPATPCLQSRERNKSKSLFRLRLTRQLHWNETLKMLRRCSKSEPLSGRF
jgi:hypothetical protein